jgi:hypothetical protein
MQSCPCPFYRPKSDLYTAESVLFLGPDQYGVPLEVVAFEQEDGEFVVVHAMTMRTKYSGQYAWVMRCRRN